jgi:ribosomal protein S24E
MKVDIISNEKNVVLKRQEIVAEIEDKTTPSREVVHEKLSATLNVPKKQLVIRQMKTRFGTNKTTIIARAYDSEEQLKSVEAKYMQKRNFKEEPKVEGASEGTEEKKE